MEHLILHFLAGLVLVTIVQLVLKRDELELGHEVLQLVLQVLLLSLEPIEGEHLVQLFLCLEHLELLDYEDGPAEPDIAEHLDGLLDIVGLDLDEVGEGDGVAHLAHGQEGVDLGQLEVSEVDVPGLQLADYQVGQMEVVQ